ncbi:hypothetical protein ACIQAC_16670 [Streptomyces sp. NPDC088387]|uniref:hypothetical protein n=1 Tax=Streptomyces sp. NPDC088387 TaxID=3365859 RepID=UPI003801280B
MSDPPPGSRASSEDTAVLMTEVVEELTRRLARRNGRPPEPADRADESRGYALERLRVLTHIKQAVRRLEDQAAHAAAQNGAGYPEIGQAVGMSRQGARRRWPGLTANSTFHPAHRPTHRSS